MFRRVSSNPGHMACYTTRMKALLVFFLAVSVAPGRANDDPAPAAGLASWYGEEHRGKLMANGERFDPDRLTAGSWFYPLGTQVRVSIAGTLTNRSVLVTITDRGPAKPLVHQGRVIDLSRAAFARLGDPGDGLIKVRTEEQNAPSQKPPK